MGRLDLFLRLGGVGQRRPEWSAHCSRTPGEAVFEGGRLPPGTRRARPWPKRPRSAGALAGFAAATEFTFGTMVQRVMTWPGGVRFHYGHPDLWNKLFIMTRGGMSKATR